jgi:hypothetical protein
MKTFTTRHDGFPPPLVAWGSSRGAAAQSDTPATTLACALAWSPACLGSANHRSGSLSRCRKATLTNKVNRRQNQILLSRLRLVGCQLLPHVRLGIPNCRAIRVGVMPGGANSIYLTARQRNFGDVHFFLMKGLGRGRPFVTKLAER